MKTHSNSTYDRRFSVKPFAYMWRLVALSTFMVFHVFSLSAQTLNWSSPVEYGPIQVGGQANGLAGVGVAAWNNRLYVAYTDNSGNGNLWLTYTTDGSTYAPSVHVVPSTVQTVDSVANPSLAVFNNRLYIAYVDNYATANFISTADGKTFSGVGGVGSHSASTASSPSLAAFNGYLYLGFRTGQDGVTSPNQLDLVKILTSGDFTDQIYPNISLGDSPALGAFANQLYIAFHDTSSNHYIYLAQSFDGTNFNLSSAATSSHTSTAPSIAVHNNVLYIAFRQNDSGDRLYYNYSTNGSTFSGPIEVSYTMGGPPAIAVATLPGSPLSGHIFNVFRQNDSGHYLFTMNAP